MELKLDVQGQRTLAHTVMGSPDAKRGTEIAVPGGAKLRYEGTLFQEAVGAPELAHFVLTVGKDLGVGLLAAWLYDKLKGRATSVRINRVEVRLDKGEIERVITEQIEGKR